LGRFETGRRNAREENLTLHLHRTPRGTFIRQIGS
jgi:hypothetical protein